MAKTNQNVGTAGHVDHAAAAPGVSENNGAAPAGDGAEKPAAVAPDAAASDKGVDSSKPAPTPTPKSVKKVPGIRIVSKSDSFRRAGLVFTKQPTDVPLSELSRTQREALAAEPMLTIERIEIEVATEA